MAQIFFLQAIRRLVSETAIYGLTSIVGRVLFFLLTPLYTNTNVLSEEQYGQMTHLFSISAFLLVLFGYGLETAFFRYSLKERKNHKKSYSTALTSIFYSTILFGGILLVLHQPLSALLNAENYSQLIFFMIIIVMLDALTSIPFANLRATNKPIRFATIKLLNIGVNLGLNLFFYVVCRKYIPNFFNADFGVGYALIANITASALSLLLLGKDYFTNWGKFDVDLWKKMLQYGWPILIVSFAGIVNEVGDRQLLKWLLPGSEQDTDIQLGIYGACYKLSIFLSLFTQAFRYAGEPFFFAQAKKKDSKQTYASVLKYFTIVSLMGFLIISLFIDLFKLFITDQSYWVGLGIVPVLLLAYVFYGMYYNMSVWYKLTDKTQLGSIVAIIGALVTILVNIVLIKYYGYWASAWATLSCFFVMVVISKFWGQKHFPVPYDWKNIILYIISSIALFFVIRYFQSQFEEQLIIRLGLAGIGLLMFAFFVFVKEKKELSSLFQRR